jgi:uncharacterized membrane protein
MDAHLAEWLNLALRWFHLVAGIAWIGSSFYFMWLDATITPPATGKAGVEGELWMVHSGGFYLVEKRRIGPGEVPPTLHWFKWEAALTWLSGMFLLGVVYYLTGGIFLVDPNASLKLSPAAAIGLSVGTIGAAWLAYDALWSSRFADQRPAVAQFLSFLLLFGIVFGYCHIFPGRAAFIHVGATLGTIMVANVWMRILPAQRRMIDATAAGKPADFTHGQRAKRRSVHNSYVTLPVIFMMLSNHYPSTYAGAWNWVVLLLLIFVGAAVRHVMIMRTKGKKSHDWLLAPVAAAVAGLVVMTAPRGADASAQGGAPVALAEVQAVVGKRCLPCHGLHPTDDVFKEPPNGVVLETEAQLRTYAPRIKARAVEQKTMPLANKTSITDAERALLGRWIDGL